MTTTYEIGSRFAGQPSRTIAELIDTLGTHPLDPRFEADGGDFINLSANTAAVRFHGNFLTLSYVFAIRTDDAEIIAQLTAAIRANQARPDYIAHRLATAPLCDCDGCGQPEPACRCAGGCCPCAGDPV